MFSDLQGVFSAPRQEELTFPLRRGVYLGLYLGCLYCFAVDSSGRGKYGLVVPDDIPTTTILGRVYERLETDDPQHIRLMA